MTPIKILSTVLALSASSTLEATISLQIDQFGLANEEGVATNGMYLGFIVDTGRNGFDLSQYTPFDLNINGQFLPSLNGISDDYYFFPELDPRPVTQSGGPFGNGAVGRFNGIPLVGEEYSTGDPFALVWFATNTSTVGSSYGFLRIGDWILPSDGGVFTEDTDIINGTLAAQYAIVPEPSTYTLAFGAIALSVVLWRRRANRIC